MGSERAKTEAHGPPAESLSAVLAELEARGLLARCHHVQVGAVSIDMAVFHPDTSETRPQRSRADVFADLLRLPREEPPQ